MSKQNDSLRLYINPYLLIYSIDDLLAQASACAPSPLPKSRTSTSSLPCNHQPCTGAFNGSWQSTRGEASRSTQVNNMTHCNGHCPNSGGTITDTRGGRTITIAFDGSAVAHWSTTNGKSGTFNLVCTCPSRKYHPAFK